MTTTNQDILLTRAETLARLRIGKTTLYGLIHSGELPQVDFGPRTKRYRVDDVDAIEARLRPQPVTEEAAPEPLPEPTSQPIGISGPPLPRGVYFVQAGPGGPIKIGYSGEVPRRIRDLQTLSPVTLELLNVRAGGHDLESALHTKLASHRTHHEWFRPAEEVLAEAYAQ